MRSVCNAAICCLAVVCGIGFAADPKPPVEPPPPTAAEIPELVKQLGDEDYGKRQAAEARLTLAGTAAETALAAVKDSQDLEVRTRATRMLGVMKTEPILKKMEAASAGTQNIEADMSISMKMAQMNTEVKSHIKSMADGKHFIMD